MDTLQYFGKECLGPTNVPRTESHVNFVRNFWGATWIRWTRSSVKCLWEWKHGKRFNLEHTWLVPAFGWAIIKNHDPWWWQCQDKPRPSVVHRRKCEGDSCAAVGKAALESTWTLRQLCKAHFFLGWHDAAKDDVSYEFIHFCWNCFFFCLAPGSFPNALWGFSPLFHHQRGYYLDLYATIH